MEIVMAYDRGDGAHTEGSNTAAGGVASHAEGDTTLACGDSAHAEGKSSAAYGTSAHAEGEINYAFGDNSHAEGYNTSTGNPDPFTIVDTLVTISGVATDRFQFNDTVLIITSTESCIRRTISDSPVYDYYSNSTTFIIDTGISDTSGIIIDITISKFAHTEGNSTKASKEASHAEGISTITNGIAAHAEGNTCQAIGGSAHAEGFGTIANDTSAHAEGLSTLANQANSHAEGEATIANGISSHAEGCSTMTQGQYSHAEGYHSYSNGTSSHTEGIWSIATRPGQHAHAGGSFNSLPGQAQNSKIELRGLATSGGGSVNLTDIDGNEFTLEDGKAYEIEIRCVAIELDAAGGDALWIHDLLVRQEAGVMTIRTDNTTLSVPGATGWTFAISVVAGIPPYLRMTFTTAIGTVNDVRVKATVRFGEISRLNS
jgi:hypothetical protein